MSQIGFRVSDFGFSFVIRHLNFPHSHQVCQMNTDKKLTVALTPEKERRRFVGSCVRFSVAARCEKRMVSRLAYFSWLSGYSKVKVKAPGNIPFRSARTYK